MPSAKISAALTALLLICLRCIQDENHWHVVGAHFRDYHLLLDEQRSRYSLDRRHSGASEDRRVYSAFDRPNADFSISIDNDKEFVFARHMLAELLEDKRT